MTSNITSSTWQWFDHILQEIIYGPFLELSLAQERADQKLVPDFFVG